MIIEVPVEEAKLLVDIFGIPIPGKEIPVAVAALVGEPQQEKPKRRFADMSPAQQAGIVCGDERFQNWIGVSNAEVAAEWVRKRCEVVSRADLNTNQNAKHRWEGILQDYRRATGLEAEDYAA